MNGVPAPSAPQPCGESYFIPVPPRVVMAMQFLGFGENLRRGPLMGNPFGQPEQIQGRILSQVEQEVYDSALKVLYTYFEGEELPSPEEFIHQTELPPDEQGGESLVPKTK